MTELLKAVDDDVFVRLLTKNKFQLVKAQSLGVPSLDTDLSGLQSQKAGMQADRQQQDQLRQQLDAEFKRLTTLIEPMIVVFMGAFVGFVVLSILLPVFEANSIVK